MLAKIAKLVVIIMLMSGAAAFAQNGHSFPEPEEKSVVLVLPVIDKSGLKFSKKELVPMFDEKIYEKFPAEKYSFAPQGQAIEIAKLYGVNDIAKIERQDLAAMAKLAGADYVVLYQMEKFSLYEKGGGFIIGHYTKYARGDIKAKVLDVKKDRYLLNDTVNVIGKNAAATFGAVGIPGYVSAAKNAVNKAFAEFNKRYALLGDV